MTPPVLIFFLDHALIRSAAMHTWCWQQVLKEQEMAVPPHQLTRWVRLGDWFGAEQLLVRHRLSTEQIETVLRQKNERFLGGARHALDPVAGAGEWIAARQGKNPMAVVTWQGLEPAGQIMKWMDWRNCFDVLIGAEHLNEILESGRGKGVARQAYVEAVQQIARRLRRSPDQCRVFSAVPFELRAARRSGAVAVGLKTLTHSVSLKWAGATDTIDDYSVLTRLDRFST